MALVQLILSLMCHLSLNCESWEIIDTLAVEVNPGHLSPDGLRFYYGLLDDQGEELLYELNRRSLKARWRGPFLLDGSVNDTTVTYWMDNMQPTVSGDGLRMVYVRNPGESWGTNDLWMASRSSKKDLFGSVRPLDELNTDDVEAYPFLSVDGNRLYYTASLGLMVSAFDQSSGRFANPRNIDLPWVETPTSCWLSSDELTILVTSDINVIMVGERTTLYEDFSVSDSIFLPEGFFVSSPSLDPGGELYVYVSTAILDEYNEVETTSDELSKIDEYDMDDKSFKSATYILRLRCKGGM